MPENEYCKLIDKDGEILNQKPGKDKMLLQCLDVSGSMSGTPMEALKEEPAVLALEKLAG